MKPFYEQDGLAHSATQDEEADTTDSMSMRSSTSEAMIGSSLVYGFLRIIAKLKSPTDEKPGQALKERYKKDRKYHRLRRRNEMPQRLTAAVFGGLSVIVPMLIMAINPSQAKTLVTSSVAVLVFALILAWRSSANMETLLATTAAYAAVMVVFVGVNGQ